MAQSQRSFLSGSRESGPVSGDAPLADEAHEGTWQDVPIPQEYLGGRLDRALSALLPGVGRKLAGQLCDSGDVRVNHRPAKKSLVLSPSARVTVRVAAWGEAKPAPHVPLDVRWESPDLVIVEKPAGLSTCAIVGSETETLAGALLARYPEMQTIGYSRREPGVLHRLDRYTSGLVVAARTKESFAALCGSLKSGMWTKKYLALVGTGTVGDEGVIGVSLRTDPTNKRRVIEAKPGQAGHPCRTEYRAIRRTPRCDLLEVSVKRAYRHQIRAHLSLVGAPLLGDEVYRGPQTSLSPRHALHASYIACATGAGLVEVESPLPADLSRLLEE